MTEWEEPILEMTKERSEELTKMSYPLYLQSPEWEAIRELILQERGYRCQVCGEETKKVNVHHNHYEPRGFERRKDLLVLCQVCHDWNYKTKEAVQIYLTAINEFRLIHTQVIAQAGKAYKRAVGKVNEAFGAILAPAEMQAIPEIGGGDGAQQGDVHPALQ